MSSYSEQELQLPIELNIPKNYTVREAIQAALEEFNVKILNNRMKLKPELYDLFVGEPVIYKGPYEEQHIVLAHSQVLFTTGRCRYFTIRIKNGHAGEAMVNTSS